MIGTRMIGDVSATNIIEYSGPTHAPDFLFPGIDEAVIDRHAAWLGPHHWNARLRRFIITIQIWVIQTPDAVIVIDGGVGNRKTRRATRMNLLNTLVPEWLRAIGAGPDDVTHVLHTHMHTDHVGWNTVQDGDRWVPTFPKARYIFPRRDYDIIRAGVAAGSLSPDLMASFNDSVVPIMEAGLGELIDDDVGTVAGCLQAEPVPGHSAGMISYRISSRGQEGVVTGDIFHSPLQIAEPQLNTRFCEVPDQALRTRAEFLARAADRRALVMPCHFGAPYCGYVERVGSGFAYRPEGA